MRVVVAPDKFKGCLSAVEVAEAIRSGLHNARPDVEVTSVPVADGGDGTVAAAIASGFTAVSVEAAGPTGAPVKAVYARDGDHAVIELANVVGLDLLPHASPDPMGSSTFGLGQVILHAVEHGANDIVLGIGGSASTDGGAGMVQALGARITGSDGEEILRGGQSLGAAACLDLSALRALLSGVSFTVACDVDNPLLGPSGAAAVFGPQKGATRAQVGQLDLALAQWAGLVEAQVDRSADSSSSSSSFADRPGSGAAGGTGYAALAVLDAELVPGIDLVLDLVGFADQVRGADLCITGEGSLDEQSLSGKTPVGVARAASRADVRVVAVAGRSLLSPVQLASVGIQAAYLLSDLEPDPALSIRHAGSLLEKVGRLIAEEVLSSLPT